MEKKRGRSSNEKVESVVKKGGKIRGQIQHTKEIQNIGERGAGVKSLNHKISVIKHTDKRLKRPPKKTENMILCQPDVGRKTGGSYDVRVRGLKK